MNSYLVRLEEKLLPQEGWMRTCIITLGVGTSVLFLFRSYLNSRRARCLNTVSLDSKICLVTGANTGIGKAVAMELACRNARVIMACRDIHKGNLALIDIRNKYPAADLKVYKLDLSSLDSVRKFAEGVQQEENRIDVLINNAGICAAPFHKSEDGIEMHFAVNHLGHFLLTNLLLDRLADNCRIIAVSSGLYKNAQLDLVNYNSQEGYDGYLAYGKSKLANILFIRELQKHLPEGVTANSMHPGIVWTELARFHMTNILLKIAYHLFGFFFLRTPKQGAQTIVYMATEPSLSGVTNAYFGDCREEALNDNAKCDKVAEKLWELSHKLTQKQS